MSVIRRLFNLAASVSMLVCVATLCLWVRSQRRADGIAFPGDVNTLWSFQGSVMAWNAQSLSGQTSQRRFRHETMPVEDAVYIRSMLDAEGQWFTKWDRLGVHVWIGRMIASSGTGGLAALTTTPTRVIILPDWLIVALPLVLPVAWIGGPLRRHRLLIHRRCTRCGYDLRASTGRCPECGTPMPSD